MTQAITLLGDVVDWFDPATIDPDKLAEELCPTSSQVKELRTRADQLDSSWSTTGYYTWEEMSRALTAIIQMSSAGSEAARQAFAKGPNSTLRKAMDDYFAYAQRTVEYNEIWKQARTTGAMIDAPTFKPWAIALLRQAATLMREAEIAACTASWWKSALSSFMSLFVTAADILVTIGKGVVAVGQAVVNAGRDLVAYWPYLKWGGIIFGTIIVGVFAYNKLDSVAAAGRRPINWATLRAKAARLFRRRGV